MSPDQSPASKIRAGLAFMYLCMFIQVLTLMVSMRSYAKESIQRAASSLGGNGSGGYDARRSLVANADPDDESVVDSLAAGAAGYIAKDAMPHEMARVVLEVRAGGAPITSAIARRVLRRFRTVAASGGSAALGGAPDACDANPAGGPEDADRLLSIRELQVLNLCAKGLSFCDVAAVLEVSLHTVRTYVKRIYRKLAVGSRAEAVFEAQQLGLI
jgi:DNA-binding NarL/FixJ family response regulator